METLLRILKAAGGWNHGLHLRIVNPPHADLVVEAMDDSGPCGLPALLVAQYADGLAGPEMYFELGFAGGAHLNPFYLRLDIIGLEGTSRFIQDAHYCYDPELHEQHETFVKLWDVDLRRQQFAEAFERQRTQPA